MYLAIQCETPSKALHLDPHTKWNLTANSIPIIGRQISPPDIYIIGDQITMTCDEAYMLTENKEKFSYTCTHNGSLGKWKPESAGYILACLGEFSMPINLK